MHTGSYFVNVYLFLNLHEIEEGFYYHCSLPVCESVCLSVCRSVCISVSEHNSSRTNSTIWTRFSLIGCLPHWPWVKGQGHSDVIYIFFIILC